jgi:hypothetical protein
MKLHAFFEGMQYYHFFASSYAHLAWNRFQDEFALTKLKEDVLDG